MVGAVVLANLLYLLGPFDPNPLGTASALGSVTKGGVLSGISTIDPNNGVVSQALSHRAVLDWVHGTVPWWNPFEGTGAPLAGEMQSASLFPLTLLTLIGNGQIYEHILLELLTGISTYLLLRRISVGRWGSTAGAIAFALNGTFAWFAHAPVNPIAFLPLLLLGIELAFSASTEGRSGGWWLIAVAGALSVYAGFPETAYIDALLALLWFGWRCACAGRQSVRAFVIKGAVGAGVGAMLAAPLLIAFADYTSHGDVGVHAGAIAAAHLPHAALPQLLLPYVYGPIFAFADPSGTLPTIWALVGGYLSTSLVMFGLLGLVSPGRRGLRAVLLAWIVLAVARTYGEPPLLGHVLGVLPGMSHVAFLRYSDPALEFAVVVLAALGVDSVAAGRAEGKRLLGVTLTSLALLAIATVEAIPLVHRLGAAPSHRVYSRASVLWAVTIIAAGALSASLRNARARQLMATLIVALEALALFALPELSAPRAVQVDTAPAAFLQRNLRLSRFFTLGPVQPNYGSYFGVRSLNADDVPLPSAFAGFVNARLDPAVNPLIYNGTPPGRPPSAPAPLQELESHLNGYRSAGVRYVLAPAGLALPHGARQFTLVFRSATTWIYRLAGSAPYFTAAGSSCTVAPESSASVRLSCPQPATLIRRETYMPGWSAQIDGRTAAVQDYQGIFQAVTVGPGAHRVTFGFAPPYLGWGLAAFAAGCLCLLFAPVRTRVRRMGRLRRPTRRDGA